MSIMISSSLKPSNNAGQLERSVLPERPRCSADKIIRRWNPVCQVESWPVSAFSRLVTIPAWSCWSPNRNFAKFFDSRYHRCFNDLCRMARSVVNNPEHLTGCGTPVVAVYDDDPQSFRNSVRMAGSIGFKRYGIRVTLREYVMEWWRLRVLLQWVFIRYYL